MHSLNLGYVLWSAGSCLVMLCKLGVWGEDDVTTNETLKRAWLKFIQWAKAKKIQPLDLWIL